MIQYLIEDEIWKSFNKVRINSILYSYMGVYCNPLQSDLETISKFMSIFVILSLFIFIHLFI